MKRIVLSACPNVDGTKWLSLPGHLTQMVYSIAWICCTCCRCWRGFFGCFFSIIYLFLSPSRRDDVVWTEMLSHWAFNPKTTKQLSQPTITRHLSVTVLTKGR